MNNKIILRKFVNTLLDVYLNGSYQGIVDELGSLDLRKQVIEKQIKGYSFKINPKFYHLFKEKDEIQNEEMFIGLNGVMSD